MTRADRRFSQALGCLASHDALLMRSWSQTRLLSWSPLLAPSENEHDPSAHTLKRHSLLDQLLCSTPLTKDSQEEMLSSNVVVIEGTHLLLRQFQNTKCLLIKWHDW